MRERDITDDELKRSVRQAFGATPDDPPFGPGGIVEGGRRRWRRRRAGRSAVVAVVVAGAVGVSTVQWTGGDRGRPDVAAGASPTPTGRVEVTGLVSDPPGGTPRLCEDSELPLRGMCSTGLELRGWSQPDGYQPNSSWTLTGTLSGDVLTVDGVTAGSARSSVSAASTLPCDEPATDWNAKLSTSGLWKVPGYSHHWVGNPAGVIPEDGSEPDWSAMVDVPTVAVTGDVAAARKAAERIKSGPVCVVHTDRPEAEGRRIAREIKHELMPVAAQASEEERIAINVGTDSSQPENGQVTVHVRYDDGTLQGRYDRRYGKRWVVVVPRFMPVGHKPMSGVGSGG